MKTPSPDLFLLVRSLSKSEKRYFKLYAQRHVLGEKNNYLKLFEAIDKQEEYDEDKLKGSFKNEKFYSYFPVAKQYLFGLILDSLHAYQQNTDPLQQIKKEIHHAELLLEKGLMKPAEKAILKAKQEAYRQEEFRLVLEALEIQKRLLAKQYYGAVDEAGLRAIYEEELDCLKKIENLAKYNWLSGQIFKIHFQKGVSRNKEEIDALDELVQDPLFRDPENATSFKAKIEYYHALATYYFLKRDATNAYKYNKSYLQLFNRHPERIETHPGRYLATLNNYLIDSLSLKHFDELESGIKKMRDLNKLDSFRKVENLEIDLFRLSYMLELNMHISRGNFEEGIKLIPDVVASLKKYQSNIVKQNIISFYYLIAYIYIGNGQYSEAQVWLNKILNDTDEGVSQDLFAFARILNLIVHYEQKNLELLEYLIKSTYRYLKKRKKLFVVEKAFLRFIRKAIYINIYDKKEMQEQFRRLRNEMLPLKEDPVEQKAFDYFNFIAWLDSKIENNTFQQTVQQSYA